jgi:hypothetical protein
MSTGTQIRGIPRFSRRGLPPIAAKFAEFLQFGKPLFKSVEFHVFAGQNAQLKLAFPLVK